MARSSYIYKRCILTNTVKIGAAQSVSPVMCMREMNGWYVEWITGTEEISVESDSLQ